MILSTSAIWAVVLPVLIVEVGQAIREHLSSTRAVNARLDAIEGRLAAMEKRTECLK